MEDYKNFYEKFGGDFSDKKYSEIYDEINSEISEVHSSGREKIELLKKSIDLSDGNEILFYGTKIQKELRQFSNYIYEKIAYEDFDEISLLIKDALKNIDDLEIVEREEGFVSKLFSKENTVEYKTNFTYIENNLDIISSRLKNQKMQLLKSIALYEKLSEKNMDHFKELEVYITAGEEIINESASESFLRNYFEKYRENDEIFKANVENLKINIESFKNRISNLKTSKLISLQMTAQLRIMKTNDLLLIERIDDLTENIIPLWKMQVAAAFGIERDKRLLNMEKDVIGGALKSSEAIIKKADRKNYEILKLGQKNKLDREMYLHSNEKLAKKFNDSLEFLDEIGHTDEKAAENIKILKSYTEK